MENRMIFREMLSEIKAAADAGGGRISKGEIRAILSGMPLTEEHFVLIYEYLAGQSIRVTETLETAGRTGTNAGSAGMKAMSQPEEAGSRAGTGRSEGGEAGGRAGSAAEGGQSAPDAGTDSPEDEHTGGLGTYLRELLALAGETFEDEHALLGRLMAGDEAARTRLIESYLPLICEAAGNLGSEELLLEDLIQEGNLGLLEALDSLGEFDSPAACSAHILNSINESMSRAVAGGRERREQGEHLVSRVNHLNEAVKNLERDLEHKVSAEELSAYLEMPLQEIRDLLRMSGDQIELEGEK